MKIIRNKRKDSNARNVHEAINDVIIGLYNESRREDAGSDEEMARDLFETCHSSSEELATNIVSATADKAAEDFEHLADGMRMDIILEMLSLLEDCSPINAVCMLQGMFLARSMKHAAKALDILFICGGYCEDAYGIFIDGFMQTDVIDWFLMERTLGEVS